jgi:hypothetical protein
MTGEPKGVTHCHCSRCRKTRGTANATNLLLAGVDGLRFTRGEELLGKYHPPGAEYYEHWFCTTCGSTMPRFDGKRNITIVPMGAFDEDPEIRPSRHIHVASKAPWDVISDDLPQFDAGPPAL